MCFWFILPKIELIFPNYEFFNNQIISVYLNIFLILYCVCDCLFLICDSTRQRQPINFLFLKDKKKLLTCNNVFISMIL